MTSRSLAASMANLSQQAQVALRKSPLFSLRSITVENDDNARLQIHGRVATFYQKQRAQEIVRAAARDAVIVNNIEVT